MTGTGVKDDPYIVDNWADYQAVYGSEVYIEFDDKSPKKEIDFNEIKPEGFTSTVKFSPYTTFNGWTFKNFFSTYSGSPLNFGGKTATLENFTFVNFYWQPVSNTSGSFLDSNSYGYITLKNCTFSGRIEVTKGKKYFENSRFKFNESALNIVVNSSEDFTLFRGNVNNSDITLDITAPTVTIAVGSVRNCRFTGKTQSENTVSLCDNGSGYNVYNLISDSPMSYASKGISVYNSDIATSSQSDEDMESLGIKFKGCTTEQLKDSDYLYNLRFPIGVD